MQPSHSPDSLAGPPARVIGIGASAGGVDALIRLMSELPAGLPHAVCVVLHVAPSGRSMLSGILDRRCRLPVSAAQDGEPLRAGHVYVAPPDRHLLVREDHVVLSRGPKENGVRPAVDVMLRSLAACHGPAAVAVVLSGALGDGSSGASAVVRAGGMVIVQDPDDAMVPSMPEHALAAVGRPDLVLGAARIGMALGELSPDPPGMRDHGFVGAPDKLIQESRRRPEGPATGFTCPECSGALWEEREASVVRYRCRVGHAYSEDAMLVEQGSAIEAAMWAALKALEERAEMLQKIAGRRSASRPRTHESLTAAAVDALERAELIRRALATGGQATDAFGVPDAEPIGAGE